MSLYCNIFHLEKSSRNIQHAEAILTYNFFFSASVVDDYTGKTHILITSLLGMSECILFAWVTRHGLHTLFQFVDLLRRQVVPILPEHTLSEQVRTTAQELPSGSASP